MEALLWTCVLGVLFTPVKAARAESPEVFQSPNAITLMKVNSTAEIHCRTILKNPTGLYLKRRFYMEMEVLYLSLAAPKVNVNPQYMHRLDVKGQCCDYTFQLSQLGVDDTDGYYCTWSKLDMESGRVMTYKSMDTIIIVREKDPKEDCNGIHSLQQILFILSVTVSAVVVCVFFGALAWWGTRTKQGYRPARPYQEHRHLCPQHSDQQYIYSNNSLIPVL